jgi:hypothetical protein
MVVHTGSHEFSWSWDEEARDGPTYKGPILISEIMRRHHSPRHLAPFGPFSNILESQGISLVSRGIRNYNLLSSLEERPDHQYSKGSKRNTRNHTRKSTTFLFWVITVSAPTL